MSFRFRLKPITNKSHIGCSALPKPVMYDAHYFWFKIFNFVSCGVHSIYGEKAVVFKTFLCVYAVFRTTTEGSVPLYLQILREAESAVSLPFSQGLCIWPRWTLHLLSSCCPQNTVTVAQCPVSLQHFSSVVMLFSFFAEPRWLRETVTMVMAVCVEKPSNRFQSLLFRETRLPP